MVELGFSQANDLSAENRVAIWILKRLVESPKGAALYLPYENTNLESPDSLANLTDR